MKLNVTRQRVLILDLQGNPVLCGPVSTAQEVLEMFTELGPIEENDVVQCVCSDILDLWNSYSPLELPEQLAVYRQTYVSSPGRL